MKGLIVKGGVIACAMVSSQAFAELTLLSDEVMGEVTGRAGLTIDIETKVDIAERAYKDEGYFLFQNIHFGGSRRAEEVAFSGGHDFLDNLRAVVDVAGNGSQAGDNEFHYGFSEMTSLSQYMADRGNTDAGVLQAAGITSGVPIDPKTGLEIDSKKQYDDGDLRIHLTYTDALQKGGGFAKYIDGSSSGDDGNGGTTDIAGLSYESAVNFATRAVDYNYSVDLLGLAGASYEVGSSGMEGYLNTTSGRINGTDHIVGLDSTPETTALLSGLFVDGYFGPIDIELENNGNGFGADGSGLNGVAGTGNADSKFKLAAYFKVEEFDIYVDIAGLQYEDIRIHNERGDRSGMNSNSAGTGNTSSFGFAHAERDLYAVKDTVLNPDYDQLAAGNYWVDGMAIDLRAKADVDIGQISFGNTGESIGSIYLTDIQLTRNWVISAH